MKYGFLQNFECTLHYIYPLNYLYELSITKVFTIILGIKVFCSMYTKRIFTQEHKHANIGNIIYNRNIINNMNIINVII